MELGFTQQLALQVPKGEFVAYCHQVKEDFHELLSLALNWLRGGQKGVQVCVTVNCNSPKDSVAKQLEEFLPSFQAALSLTASSGEVFQAKWHNEMQSGSPSNIDSDYCFARFLVVTRTKSGK